MFVVPLKFMCSTQCETPVRPGRSSFEPTRYQHHTDASGAVCSSWMSTFKPLSSIVERITFHYKIVGLPHAGVERHSKSTADRLPDEGQPAGERAADAGPLAANGSLRPYPRGAGRAAEIRASRRPAVRQRQHP